MNGPATASAPTGSASSFASDDGAAAVIRRHLRIGWLSLLLFLALGLVLEALHGFKVQAYLSVMNETRRLMWTLAHAHGTLIGLGHLGFAFTASFIPAWQPKTREVASYMLIAAGVLMPIGFLLGGIWTYAGDPGLGIILVPVGGLLLLGAVVLTSCSLKYLPANRRTAISRRQKHS